MEKTRTEKGKAKSLYPVRDRQDARALYSLSHRVAGVGCSTALLLNVLHHLNIITPRKFVDLL